MKVLLDLNFRLDIVLARSPWYADATELSNRIAAGAAQGFVAAHSLPTLFYICRKSRDAVAAFTAVDQCIRSFEIVPLSRDLLLQARSLSGVDLEDNLQIASAVQIVADYIVTRDASDFKHSPIPTISPDSILQRI
jgi:hypothetical protein